MATRNVPISQLPEATIPPNDTDELVLVQPFGSVNRTTRMPVAPIMDAARAAGASAVGDIAESFGLVFQTVSEAAAQVGGLNRAVGDSIKILAYATAGDMGDGIYKKVSAEPSHEGKFQDTSGAWWGLTGVTACPEQFGAIGNGVIDDTAALDAALGYLPVEGTLLLRDGKTYATTGVVLPNKYLTIMALGEATLLGITGPDNRFVLATSAWYINRDGGDGNFTMRNVTIDANNIKDYANIVMNYSARFENCRFYKALVVGQLWTSESENGNNTGLSIGGHSYLGCDWRYNTGWGFANTLSTADAHFVNCRIRENLGGGMNLVSCAGMQIDTCKYWGNDFSDLGLPDLRLNKFGLTQVMNCNFEGIVDILSVNANDSDLVFGPGNLIYNTGKIIVTMAAGSGTYTTIIDDNHFTGAAHIVQNFNDPSRRILLRGGASDDPLPVRWATGSSNPLGQVVAEKHWNRAANGWLDGPIRSRPSDYVLPIAPNEAWPVRKRLNADTSSTMTLTLTVPPDSGGAGSRVSMQIDAMAIVGTSPVCRRYSVPLTLLYCRQFNSATHEYAATLGTEVMTSGAAMSGAVVVSVSGSVGDHEVVLTFNLTHPAVSTVASTEFVATAHAEHYATMTMTLV